MPALASTSLSILLLAASILIFNARIAGPYFAVLAENLPPPSNEAARDLSVTARHIADVLALARKNADTRQAARDDAEARADQASSEPVHSEHSAATSPNVDWLSGDWLSGDWFSTDRGWLAGRSFDIAWLDPRGWFGGKDGSEPSAPSTPQRSEQQGGDRPDAQSAYDNNQEASEVIVLLPRDSENTPRHKIVIAPQPNASRSVTTSMPSQGDAAVRWFPDAPPPDGVSSIILSGANVSSMPLEDIQATLKPDSHDTALGFKGLALSLQLPEEAGGAPNQNVDGRAVPPGARFYLKAESLSGNEVEQLGGAIVSFAYSQAGRRRTSILYLKQPGIITDAATE